MSDVAMVDADLTFHPPEESGRTNLKLLLSGLQYRPHIVIGDPTQRHAVISPDRHLTETMCGVAFAAGPSHIEANVACPVTMMLMYWPHALYDSVVPGATFTLREGPNIVGFGKITRRWIQEHLPSGIEVPDRTRIGGGVVSAAQVDIYTTHNGDIDLYQRGGPQMAILGDSWNTIEDLRRRLFLVAVGRASATFASSVEADLLNWTSDEDARRRIRAIVEGDVNTQLKS